MSVYHSDKATKESLTTLKEKVLAVLNSAGIDTNRLSIRSLPCFGGDVRVYLNELEVTNRRVSFRANGKVTKEGNKTIIYGDRGKFSKMERQFAVFNEEDFSVPRSLSMIDYNILEIKKFLSKQF